MKILVTIACAVALAGLTSCGQRGDSLPASAAFPAARHTGSWMSAEAKKTALLYASDLNTGDVEAFSYPAGKLEGTLTGFSAPHGDCVDKAGDLFVTNTGSSQIFEYAHGGTTPIAILADEGYEPNGCSVNPVTGDLAVANIFPPHSGSGSLAIFKHARGKPKMYFTESGLFRYYSCGYDDRGNLFVDGTNEHVTFELAELPAGAKKLVAITLDQPIRYPGGVRWNKNRLVVGDQYYLSGPSVVYEFAMSGSQGMKVGTTPLSDSCDVLQFWIDGKRLIAPDDCSPYVKYYAYPAGGASTKSIGDPNQPIGVTISR